MTEVENSQTGRPIVIPGRDNVAIYGAPISPQEEKGLGFPPGEILDWWTPLPQPKINEGTGMLFRIK